MIKSKHFKLANLLLIGAVFVFGFQGQSYFEMSCAVCAALFWLCEMRFSSVLNKDETTQKKVCRSTGFFLLLPAIGIILNGVVFYMWPHFAILHSKTYTVIGFAGLLIACLILQIISLRHNNTVASRFAKQSMLASLSAPMSLVVLLMLKITVQADATILGCMSAVLFGCGAFFFAIEMILVSSCNYLSTVDSVKMIWRLYKKHSLIFTRASIIKDAFFVVGKIIFSILSLSFFMIANAFYSVGMGAARFVAIKMYIQTGKEKIKNYRLVGAIISIASACYVLYAIRLFFGGTTGTYNMNLALIIALYTFVEFGINIREAIRLRRSRVLEAKALRAISFSSTLLCFVLTQVAIMSFAFEGSNNFANALSGVVFGGLAMLTGLYVVMDSYRYEKPHIEQ